MDSSAPPSSAEGAVDRSLLAVIEESCSGGGWRIQPRVGRYGCWISVLSSRALPPDQGWKLHLSAAVPTAEAVLCRALPVLLAEGANFKVVGSLDALGQLNSGDGGMSQIGKFITAYPEDDSQAVRLAIALDRATRGLRGPGVPSDRPFAPGGLVHYRYGGFGDRRVRLPLGTTSPAIVTPEGEIVPDRRGEAYYAPPWVVDPFVAAGAAERSSPPKPVVGDRYLVVSTLYRSPRGSIYLAMDIDCPKVCILKQACRDAYLDADGRDARDRLRHEAEILARLAPDPRFPEPYGLVEHNGDLFLAMEEVEGETLERHVQRMLAQGRFPPTEQVAAWGRELAAALGTLHGAGFVYRDVKSPNVMVTPGGRLRLLDFETAHERAAATPPFGRGTRGFASPQQEGGDPPAVADDIYGLGALLYYLATGVEPSHAPRPSALLDRPIRLANPGMGHALAEIIGRLLDPDPAKRPPSMEAVASALPDADGTPHARFGGEHPEEREEEAMDRSRRLADRLGDTLCRAAQRASDGPTHGWITSHPAGDGEYSRDINTGGAGAVLALAELVSELRDPGHAQVLWEGAQWLASAPPPGGSILPGLYIGEAGVGAALLRAGLVLKRDDLIEAAAARGRTIAHAPHTSPDLFNGTAGRLRFHLLLWDATGDPGELDSGMQAGDVLLRGAEDAGGDTFRWEIPPGYGELSGIAYLGYAHGTAGIADALLDLFDATGEERFLGAARGAGRWLERMAVPMLDDQSGLGWPSVEGGAPAPPLWCHGAAGIGRFFLHLARAGVVSDEIAARAARTVARGGRFIGPTQCHGLAGSIEFLLDMFQATGDAAYLREARSLARLLEAFGLEQDGRLVWPSESPAVFSPDYMVGYAGVLACLLRLGAPDRLPHQLSRSGFAAGPALPRSTR